MKKFKHIIATVFVVAMGAVIFFACQKESYENKKNSVNTIKIQKDVENAYFFYDSEPDVFYRVIDSMVFTFEGTVVCDKGYLEGCIEHDSQGRYKGFSCDPDGSNCGSAYEVEGGEVLRTGMWCRDPDTEVTYIEWDHAA